MSKTAQQVIKKVTWGSSILLKLLWYAFLGTKVFLKEAKKRLMIMCVVL